MGDLVFFIIKSTNISVLLDFSINTQIYALLNMVKGQAELEMLALIISNREFYIIHLWDEREMDVSSYLFHVEQSINDNSFTN